MDATEYWDVRYTLPEGIEHHARQNETIAKDFVREVRDRPSFWQFMKGAHALEIGCGTGDLACKLQDSLYCATSGTDLSGLAVEVARIRFPHMDFMQFDILKDPAPSGFDLVVASNVIEHFRDPIHVIEKMFEIAPRIVLLTPFNQPVTDGYDNEGGAGHVVCITLDTFAPYKIEDHFFFRTDGWQHSSKGEIPTQLAIILSKKP